MFGSRTRAVAVSVAVAGAVALAVTTTTAANAVTITSGTGTLTVNQSYLLNLAKHGIVVVPTHTQTLAYNATAKTVTVVYSANGGDADVNSFSGEVDYTGGLTFLNALNGKHVSLNDLFINIQTDVITGIQSDGVSATDVLDADGTHVATISGTTQNLSASDLEVDANGAAFLNSALATTAFSGGDEVGGFATSYVAN